jgi:hypothetical protein
LLPLAAASTPRFAAKPHAITFFFASQRGSPVFWTLLPALIGMFLYAPLYLKGVRWVFVGLLAV